MHGLSRRGAASYRRARFSRPYGTAKPDWRPYTILIFAAGY